MKYDTITFIEKANKIHNNKYDYSKVEYTKSNIKIKIICSKHGIFEQTPVSHIRNDKPRGCPFCAGRNKTTKQFISEATKIHNNKYDYSKVKYVNATTPTRITCPIHGDFEQKPSSHLNGWGCKICGGNNRLTNNEFIVKANTIHNNKYKYNKTKYINSHTKITITCPIHGDFEQKPNNHLTSANCPHCMREESIKKRTYSRNDFIVKSNKIHNSKYDYSKVIYIKSKNKIKIICPIHSIFIQQANSHLLGHGCPNCIISKGEIKIKNYLESKNISYVSQKKFNDCKNKNNRKLKFDFYLPIRKILIEFDGKQHYEPIEYFGGSNQFKKIKENDKIKNNYATENNIKLIRISYKDFDIINNILNDMLLI